ncbi:MAG: hypothetical protein KAV87_55670 [Desulfobacteraceae bacterium]|nr:hypothetical protein [Desulfobacteraceae bacterium]
MNKTQRDEMIDLENAKTTLLEALRPFAEAVQGLDFQHIDVRKKYWEFDLTDSSGRSISMGNLQHAMEIYEKFSGRGKPQKAA